MEILSYIPGQAKVEDVIYNKEKDIWIPKYQFSDLSYEYAKAQELGMRKAMDELLHPLVPGFPSKADAILGTSWSAK